MEDLLGRLRRSNPEASEAIKVIGYFDRLVAGGVSLATLTRGAAMLAGAPAGYRSETLALRFEAGGEQSTRNDPSPTALRLPAGAAAEVWLERSGPARPTDAIVLERLALAVTANVSNDHARHNSALEAILQPVLDAAGHLADARARLQLSPDRRYRAVAQKLDAPPARSPSTVLATPWGLVRGLAIEDGDRVDELAGIGRAVGVAALAESWSDALLMLRLADGATPSTADSFGPLLDVLRRSESDASDDLRAIGTAEERGWTVPTLTAIAEGRGLRVIAREAGRHHSSIDARFPRLTAILGYDPRTPIGRTRLHLGVMAYRLARTRFD